MLVAFLVSLGTWVDPFSRRLPIVADLAVLSHFFSHPGEDLHVRRVAADLGEPVGTVGRELARLERAGLFSSLRVGNQRRYTLCAGSPVLDDLRNIFLKTMGVGAELRAALENV